MTQPRLGAAAVVTDADDRVLMGQSNKDEIAGLWVLPGGGIEEGETPEQAVTRELLAEAGVVIAVGQQIHEGEIKAPDGSVKRHIRYFAASMAAGTLQAGDDLQDVRFCTRRELAAMHAQGLITPFVAGVLRTLGWL